MTPALRGDLPDAGTGWEDGAEPDDIVLGAGPEALISELESEVGRRPQAPEQSQ